MKRLKFGTKELNIKSDSLERIVTSAVGCPMMTRESVSLAASVSLSSAGKLLSALDECAFTDLRYSRIDRSGPPAKGHVFHSDLWVLVLDLSSSVYAAHIFSRRENTVITEKHSYDPTLSFENNLIALLSRIGLKISSLPYSVSAICTVLSDNCAEIQQSNAKYLPNDSDLATVNAYCARFFGLMPSFSLSYSQALSCAAKYNLLSARNGKSTAYIGLCESTKAIYLPSGAPAISLKINELMIDSRTLLRDVDIGSIDSSKAAELVARLINLMSCAYSVDGFAVEADLTRFPDIPRKLELILMSLELKIPPIEYYDSNCPNAVLGASYELISDLILAHIRGK